MTRHQQYIKGQVQHNDLIVIVQGDITGRNGFIGRPRDPGAGCLLDGHYAAHMVIVVVGNQNIGQLPVGIVLQPLKHRGGIARIDHGAK